MDQIKIGAFLKTLRKEKNLTQEQAAEQLGVHSIWIRGFDSKTVVDTFGLPEHMIPVMMLGLGYPNDRAKANGWHYKRKPIEDFVFEL